MIPATGGVDSMQHLGRFGLREDPFGVTPDPRYFFPGKTHEEALSSLIYGIEKRAGFVLVTGEVGTGKTLLCRAVLARLGPQVRTALVLNPDLGPLELLRAIASDFGLETGPPDKVQLLESLNRFLLSRLSAGENVVLIIDESQLLPDDSLEQIRLLSNLETNREKLIQLVLVGQPELLEKLGRPHLRQVAQRISVRFHLRRLAFREVPRYVGHRIRLASVSGEQRLFGVGALWAVAALSRGCPREINALCERSLLAAYASGRRRVGLGAVYRAFRDLGSVSRPERARPSRLLRWLAVPLLLAAIWIAAGSWDRTSPPPPPTPVPPGVPAGAVPAAPEPSPAPPAPPAPGKIAEAEPPFPVESLHVALARLARLWGLEELASEVQRWNFVKFEARLLPAFFRKTGLGERFEMDLRAVPATVYSLRALDLPCIAVEKSPPGGGAFVLLSAMRGDEAVVVGPSGRGEARTLPAAGWLEGVQGDAYCLVPAGEGSELLRPGDRGPKVLALQEELARAGYLRGKSDGIYLDATREAVVALQRRSGLVPDGVAGLHTRMRLRRKLGAGMPSLRESP